MPLSKFNLSLLSNIAESLGDISKYLDERAIQYAIDNYTAAKVNGVKSQMEKFAELARNESDPIQRMYYENRMYLPPEQAMFLAKEFYQKEIRSGTGSLDLFSGDEASEMGDTGSVLNFTSTYGNPGVDKGMFANLVDGSKRTPERLLELDDFVTKLFGMLSDSAQIVLIARLLTGGSTGRQRGSSKSGNLMGLDLAAIMKKLPAEYKTVVDKMEELHDQGVNPDEVTTQMILTGNTQLDRAGLERRVKGLLAKWEITAANEELKKAMQTLTKQHEVKDIAKFMHVNESIEESADKRSLSFMKVLNSVLTGGKVTTSDMISAVVFAVTLNQKYGTQLSRSKMFSGSTKDVAKAYMKLAKSGNIKDVYKLQDLFMAPVIDLRDPLKLRDLRKRIK